MPGQFINSGNAGKVTLANNSNSGRLTFIKPPTVYTVGQAALGGLIAYITGGGSSGTSGLVITSTNTSTNIKWGCQGTSIGTSSGIGTGNANTLLIVANCAEVTTAARLCNDLVQGGYSDWYLPSLDELTAILANRASLNLPTEAFWTSTQQDANNAYYVNFGSLFIGPVNKGSDTVFGSRFCRAIRSF